jgi:hypothetical protein
MDAAGRRIADLIAENEQLREVAIQQRERIKELEQGAGG